MDKKVTISDVAERANVSKATVSRVLNRPEIVAPELLNRIHLAMSELNYTPNRHARALSGVRTKTVGLLFFEDLWDLVLNPFWAMATSTVYEHLLRHDLDCSLIALGGSVTSQERFSTPALYEEFLRSRNVDGFLLVGNLQVAHEQHFVNSVIPSVMWGRPAVENAELTYADSNNAMGAKQGVDYLIGQGRQRIATITGDLSLVAARDRHAGYVQALTGAGLAVDPMLVAHGNFSRDSGALAMRHLLDTGRRIDALFAANDEMARGALDVLDERGISVPTDIAIVGFDNVTLPQRKGPGLTTISHSFDQIGEELVIALAAKMRGESYPSRLIDTKLVIRDTA